MAQTPGLREVRQAHGYGMRELARAAGIDPGDMSRIERGLKRPNADMMHRIAVELGLRNVVKSLEIFWIPEGSK